jgi:hypothetical protein
MVPVSAVDIEGIALYSVVLDLIATTRTDLDWMLFSLLSKRFWDQHIDMTLGYESVGPAASRARIPASKAYRTRC